MPKIFCVMGRARAYLRAVKRGDVVVVPALLLLLLMLAMVWIGYQPTSREAVGQDKSGENTASTRESKELLPPAPESSVPELFPERPEEAITDERAIPELSAMDVIGYLQYLPDSNFRCSGPSFDRGLTKWVCRSSSEDDSPVTLEVSVVEESPGTVPSVTATASNATDEMAADFFSYVAELSLEGVDPINPKTWVAGSISSGGQYLAEGAIPKLYGIEGARTLEIMGTASAEESRRKGLRPKVGQP